MSGCGTRIVLRGQKPLALCDRCPCFGSLFPPLAALTFAASSIICAFGLASAVPRSPYRHLELCGIALYIFRLLPILLSPPLASRLWDKASGMMRSGARQSWGWPQHSVFRALYPTACVRVPFPTLLIFYYLPAIKTKTACTIEHPLARYRQFLFFNCFAGHVTPAACCSGTAPQRQAGSAPGVRPG